MQKEFCAKEIFPNGGVFNGALAWYNPQKITLNKSKKPNQPRQTGKPFQQWTISNSHHQDYYIFSRDSYKPSFATVTGRGDSPTYIQVSEQIFEICPTFSRRDVIRDWRVHLWLRCWSQDFGKGTVEPSGMCFYAKIPSCWWNASIQHWGMISMSQRFWLSKIKAYASICQKQKTTQKKNWMVTYATFPGWNMRKLPSKSWRLFWNKRPIPKSWKRPTIQPQVIHPTIPWIYQPDSIPVAKWSVFLVGNPR